MQTVGSNSCSIVLGDVANCLYGLTSSHEFASQFGLAILLYAKNSQKLSRRPGPAQVSVECAYHGRSIASDNMSDDNSQHCSEWLSQNGDNQIVYLHDFEQCCLDIMTQPIRLYSVCKHQQWRIVFLMLSRLKIHIILFLGRLRRDA